MNKLETPEKEKEVGYSIRKANNRKTIKLKLKQIKPYKNNSKIHTDKQIKKLRDLIIKFGYTTKIEVDENNVILAGHGRLKALQQIDKTGKKEIEVKQIKDFTESEKKAYRIGHNKVGLDTGFDVEILKEEFHDLEDTENFNDTGFEPEEITEIWESQPSKDAESRNSEINLTDLKSKLVHTCPRCKFQFGKKQV